MRIAEGGQQQERRERKGAERGDKRIDRQAQAVRRVGGARPKRSLVDVPGEPVEAVVKAGAGGGTGRLDELCKSQRMFIIRKEERESWIYIPKCERGAVHRAQATR